MLTSPILVIGWIIIGIAQNKVVLYLGRIISSFAAGFPISSTLAYISETAHPRL